MKPFIFKDLYEFLDRAVKNRKYAENTGYGLRAALRLFEAELTDDEKDSLDTFSNNLEQIYANVCRKNTSKYSAGSLAVYKSRVQKVLKNFKSYGEDPTKMVNWTPKTAVRHSVKPKGRNDQGISTGNPEMFSPVAGNMQRFEITAGTEGGRAVLILPKEITEEDATRLKGYIDLSVSKEASDKQKKSQHAD